MLALAYRISSTVNEKMLTSLTPLCRRTLTASSPHLCRRTLTTTTTTTSPHEIVTVESHGNVAVINFDDSKMNAFSFLALKQWMHDDGPGRNSAPDFAVHSSEFGAREQSSLGPALERTGSPADGIIVRIGGLEDDTVTRDAESIFDPRKRPENKIK